MAQCSGMGTFGFAWRCRKILQHIFHTDILKVMDTCLDRLYKRVKAQGNSVLESELAQVKITQSLRPNSIFISIPYQLRKRFQKMEENQFSSSKVVHYVFSFFSSGGWVDGYPLSSLNGLFSILLEIFPKL